VRRIDSRLGLLQKNPNDPRTLVEVGYFIYSEKIHPTCYGKASLFIRHHSKACAEYIESKPKFSAFSRGVGDYKQKWEQYFQAMQVHMNLVWEGTLVPVDLFVLALEQYEKLSKSDQEEARVLRILIFCFKGVTNQANCVRNRESDYPNLVRGEWYRKLHEKFPEAAKKTPYWY